jgi:hypothetical protein
MVMISESDDADQCDINDDHDYLFWLMDYNGIMAIDANLIINDNMQ